MHVSLVLKYSYHDIVIILLLCFVSLVLLVLVIKHKYDKHHVYLDKLRRSGTANSIPVARRIMLYYEYVRNIWLAPS